MEGCLAFRASSDSPGKGRVSFERRGAWGRLERRLDNKQTIVQFMDYLKSKGISDDVLLFIWKKHFEKDFSAGNKDLMTKDAKAILDEARRLQATHHPENGIPPSRNAPSFETIMAAEENQLHLDGVGVQQARLNEASAVKLDQELPAIAELESREAQIQKLGSGLISRSA